MSDVVAMTDSPLLESVELLRKLLRFIAGEPGSFGSVISE